MEHPTTARIDQPQVSVAAVDAFRAGTDEVVHGNAGQHLPAVSAGPHLRLLVALATVPGSAERQYLARRQNGVSIVPAWDHHLLGLRPGPRCGVEDARPVAAAAAVDQDSPIREHARAWAEHVVTRIADEPLGRRAAERIVDHGVSLVSAPKIESARCRPEE